MPSILCCSVSKLKVQAISSLPDRTEGRSSCLLMRTRINSSTARLFIRGMPLVDFKRQFMVATSSLPEDKPRPPDSVDDDGPERDEDGLYYGTYSTFFTDPEQLKGM
eukprot:scaffold151229_cov36-Prasinocladus_malaysianus.AAC.2